MDVYVINSLINPLQTTQKQTIKKIPLENIFDDIYILIFTNENRVQKHILFVFKIKMATHAIYLPQKTLTFSEV